MTNLQNNLKGKFRENVDLSKTTWFQVGGKARTLYRPYDEADLRNFLEENKSPIAPLGACSNIIIRDGGIDGTVIKLGQKFTHIDINDNLVTIGAGCLDYNAAHQTAKLGLSGLEFLSTIPGTIGGAIAMNAGCYGSETSDFLHSCKAVRIKDGKSFNFLRKDVPFSYRANELSPEFIFVNATFNLSKKPILEIQSQIKELIRSREESQPTKQKTGGSTFKNPYKQKAWELIDRCNLRGYRVGGAEISQKHCNFIINTGDASASDIENLGEYIIKTVYEKTGIKLEWEIKRIGQR
ncbi:MAG: UDP-N-acetylmuramate dehydrogenase [Rickettsiales bacterium]